MNKPSLTLSLLLICGSLLAQSDTRPSPPFVRVPPPGSAWFVDIEDTSLPKKKDASSAPDASKNGGRPISLPVRLSFKAGRNGVTMGTILYSDGRQEEYYVTNGFLFQKTSNSETVLVLPVKDSEMDPASLRVGSFPGVGWLSKENYKGTQKKKDADIWYFTHTEYFGQSHEPGPKLEAWIRAEDRHPIEAHVGDRI